MYIVYVEKIYQIFQGVVAEVIFPGVWYIGKASLSIKEYRRKEDEE